MELGKINELIFSRFSTPGAYFMNAKGEEVLLPNKFTKKNYEPLEKVNLFIYKDGEERMIATTQKPFLCAGEVGFLLIKQKTQHGYFLDWGLEKDLFLPYGESAPDLQEEKKILVVVNFDSKSERMYASANLPKFIHNRDLLIQENEEVKFLLTDQSEIGYIGVINNLHWGLLYKNEVFKELKRGEVISVFVKKIREDFKVDLILQKPGFENVADELQTKIMEYLYANQGFLKLTDASSPEDIYSTLEMSKKNFKKAVGMLYKQKLISLSEKGVHLVK